MLSAMATVLCTLRYLEAKAEKMYQAGKQMQTNFIAAQRTIAFNNNRRILKEARRHRRVTRTSS